jgi:TetR/AcrR family transcriptional repressor of mexJK operon
MTPTATRDRILDAATELFLGRGYGSTNLEQVAAKAGVTKPTVYSHFGSKQGLLDAMIARHTDVRLQHFASRLHGRGDPRSDLMQFAEAFVTTVMSEEARAWQRLGTAESDRYPELGAAFFNSGPKRVFEALADYLRREKKAGRLTFPNAHRAAEQFLGMLVGMDLLRSLVGQPKTTPAELKKRCRETVAVFLSAYGTEASEHPSQQQANRRT